MKLSHKFVALGAASLVVGLAPSGAYAEDYDSNDSDNPVRLYMYPLHAYGKGLEYFVTRPIHWVVSQPKARYIFGKTSNPRNDNYWGDWDQYQRYSY